MPAMHDCFLYPSLFLHIGHRRLATPPEVTKKVTKEAKEEAKEEEETVLRVPAALAMQAGPWI